jgi:hypothetical protein
MTLSQRDAECIAECLRLLLPQGKIAQRSLLSLEVNGISDEAIDVFGDFLRETPCHLHSLSLWHTPPQQVSRLSEALKTNRSVKELVWIFWLECHEGALWIADLLRHKTGFTCIRLWNCQFPLTQILSLLRDQRNLQTLELLNCRTSSGAFPF